MIRRRERDMLLMYTHPLFKKRRRQSPPQASLGDYECACSRSEKKKTKQGAWFYRALEGGRVGLKIGLIRPKRNTAEVMEEGGGLGLKIGL